MPTGRKKAAEQRKAVITKRLLLSRSRRAFADAAQATMKVVGFNVVASNNQVVKLMEDGSVEVIGRIAPRKKLTPSQIRKALAR